MTEIDVQIKLRRINVMKSRLHQWMESRKPRPEHPMEAIIRMAAEEAASVLHAPAVPPKTLN